MYRIYQYQTPALWAQGEDPCPQAGDWMVQKRDRFGYWRNVAGPFGSEGEAQKEKVRYARVY